MTEFSVSQQIWQMIQMVLWGWLMMFSSHQKQSFFKMGRWSYRKRTASDFLFCVFWAVSLWLILLQVSGGLVRNYVVLGLAGGITVYQLFFRKKLERCCRLLAKGSLFIWHRFWRMLLWPWRIFFETLFMPWINRVRKFWKEKQEFAIAEENIIENENKFLS
jgi:hypothetical protein